MPFKQADVLITAAVSKRANVFLRIAFYLAVVAGLLSLDVLAVPAADGQPEGKVVLKPSLCIVKRGEKSCRVDLDVRWTASQPNEYCVFKRGQPGPLQCWQNSASGQHTDSVRASNSQNYQLVWLSDNAKVELGEAVLQVVNVVPEDRRRQRRRRHVWSVF